MSSEAIESHLVYAVISSHYFRVYKLKILL